MNATQATDVHIRWMLKRDFDRVLAIEQASFASPWTRGDLIAVLRGRNTIGIVAEDQRDTVLGFAVYDLLPVGVRLLDIAVAPEARHRGVGRKMICRLIQKLSPALTDKRRILRAWVSERNLGAQLFLQRCGFVATSIEHDAYGSPDHDAYRMDYTASAFGGRFSRTMKGL